MLVDDDKDDQMIFLSAINEIDKRIACECYNDARRGLQVLQMNTGEKPHCIFVDLNLPFMHGFEFLRKIKTMQGLENIPVIIYSTSSRESDRTKAKELGAFNFLSKPANITELKVRIAELLSGVPGCEEIVHQVTLNKS